MSSPSSTKIAIVGAGNVGTTTAYALLLSGLAAEIVLIDKNRKKVEGEVMDLNHSVPLTHPTRIYAGEISDCDGAVVTVLAAGAGQKPGESRLDLLKKNNEIFKAIVPEIASCNPAGILLIATNPVDILTYSSWKRSGLPPERVIGSGTILDTARFRHLLSRHFGVEARSVHAFIIGEHGDSEVPVWSRANIAGMTLKHFAKAEGIPLDQTVMDNIFEDTRTAAYKIIEGKGATFYAVAVGLLRIIEAILRDQRTVLSVSSLISGYYGIEDVCFSLPTIIDRSGINKVLSLNLDEAELAALRRSAQLLKANAGKLE
jgi:L-lactate dehydrogenase